MITCMTYSVKEAASIMGVSVSKMYQMVNSNFVPNIKLGKCYLIPVKEFTAFFNNSIQGGNNL